jgi:hypothetical protein
VNQAGRFAKTLWDMLDPDAAPLPDETPLITRERAELPAAAAPPTTITVEAEIAECARCCGEGQVVRGGKPAPCPAPGCPFVERKPTP